MEAPGIVLPSGFILSFETLDLHDLDVSGLVYNASLVRRWCGLGMTVAQHTCQVITRVHDLMAEDPSFWSGRSGVAPEDAERASWGHDAPEALGLCDMPSPWKEHSWLSGYRKAERAIYTKVADRFNLPRVIPAVVRRADLELAKTEQVALELVPPWPDKLAKIEPLKGVSTDRWPRHIAAQRLLAEAERLGIR